MIRPEGDLAGPEADALRRVADVQVGRGTGDLVIDLEAVPFLSGSGSRNAAVGQTPLRIPLRTIWRLRG